jgi:putative flavoprotein involved in K+ transport
MLRADVVRHLEQYAASFQAPVRCGVHVTAVDPRPDGQGYRVATEDGTTHMAATVVVATGSFQVPKPSSFSRNLPTDVLQLHSSHYRNPSALRSGAVLIVGSADTGCQLAEELNESGRRVYLCVGRALRRPRRYRGKDAMFWSVTRRMIEETQFASLSDRFAPNPQLTGKNGGHTLNLHQLARDGVTLLGRLVSANGDRIRSLLIYKRTSPMQTRPPRTSRTESTSLYARPAWSCQRQNRTRSTRHARTLVGAPRQHWT